MAGPEYSCTQKDKEGNEMSLKQWWSKMFSKKPKEPVTPATPLGPQETEPGLKEMPKPPVPPPTKKK